MDPKELDKTKRHLIINGKAQGYDEDRRLVWGFVSATDITDLQGDIIDVEEFKKMYDRALDKYNAGALTINGNHRLVDVADIHETSKLFVADTVRWYVCVKVKNEEVWQEGKAKGFHGFSIGGWWERNWDRTRGAYALTAIDLDEFSLLYSSWDEEGRVPVMPANQLATVLDFKSASLKDRFQKLWGELSSLVNQLTTKGDHNMDPKLKEEIQELVKGEIKTALDEFKKALPAGFTKDEAAALFDEKAKSLPAPMSKEDIEKLITGKSVKADIKEDETIKGIVTAVEKLTTDVKTIGETLQKSQHKEGTEEPELKGMARTAAALEKRLAKK